jgi:hypothetical protein
LAVWRVKASLRQCRRNATISSAVTIVLTSVISATSGISVAVELREQVSPSAVDDSGLLTRESTCRSHGDSLCSFVRYN